MAFMPDDNDGFRGFDGPIPELAFAPLAPQQAFGAFPAPAPPPPGTPVPKLRSKFPESWIWTDLLSK